MIVKRDRYLEKLKHRMWNRNVKIITGVRRSGKSVLLSHIFKDYLLSEGVHEDHIIFIDLDRRTNREYRDPDVLLKYIYGSMTDEKYYVMLDEIQFLDDFVSVLNELSDNENIDVYVTGSNSKFLSKDVATEFRDRGDEIHIYPLTFSEFFQASDLNKYDAWDEYCMYGGMPALIEKKTDEEKTAYLQKLINETYLTDVIERNHIEKEDLLGRIFSSLCSSIGSLTNPDRTCASLKANGFSEVTNETVGKYFKYLEDAFIFEKSERYDVRGKQYFSTPYKYYASDVGLRNARINFRQQELTHIMENIVYIELRTKGYSVDVGVVRTRESEDGKSNLRTYEIDFVANKGSERLYIQSAFTIPGEEKREQEVRPFRLTKDSFRKIIVTADHTKPWYDEEGVLTTNIVDFLLRETI